jgi:hypothetical protein
MPGGTDTSPEPVRDDFRTLAEALDESVPPRVLEPRSEDRDNPAIHALSFRVEIPASTASK